MKSIFLLSFYLLSFNTFAQIDFSRHLFRNSNFPEGTEVITPRLGANSVSLDLTSDGVPDLRLLRSAEDDNGIRTIVVESLRAGVEVLAAGIFAYQGNEGNYNPYFLADSTLPLGTVWLESTLLAFLPAGNVLWTGAWSVADSENYLVLRVDNRILYLKLRSNLNNGLGFSLTTSHWRYELPVENMRIVSMENPNTNIIKLKVVGLRNGANYAVQRNNELSDEDNWSYQWNFTVEQNYDPSVPYEVNFLKSGNIDFTNLRLEHF